MSDEDWQESLKRMLYNAIGLTEVITKKEAKSLKKNAKAGKSSVQIGDWEINYLHDTKRYLIREERPNLTDEEYIAWSHEMSVDFGSGGEGRRTIKHKDFAEIVERHQLNPDPEKWTESERAIVRLALP